MLHGVSHSHLEMFKPFRVANVDTVGGKKLRPTTTKLNFKHLFANPQVFVDLLWSGLLKPGNSLILLDQAFISHLWLTVGPSLGGAGSHPHAMSCWKEENETV